MTKRRTSRLGAVLFLGGFLCACAATPSNPAPVLTPAERSAINDYFAELKATAGSDVIIDGDDPAVRDRIQRSSHPKMKGPEVPADLRRQHAHGRVIVAGVVERDATVTHAKVVGPSGYPAFDEVARRAVAEARYDAPTKLDGKPVRCFAYMVIDFEAS
jgi:TonB family protein